MQISARWSLIFGRNNAFIAARIIRIKTRMRAQIANCALQQNAAAATFITIIYNTIYCVSPRTALTSRSSPDPAKTKEDDGREFIAHSYIHIHMQCSQSHPAIRRVIRHKARAKKHYSYRYSLSKINNNRMLFLRTMLFKTHCIKIFVVSFGRDSSEEDKKY